MTLSELRREDYVDLSLHFIVLLLALGLVGGMSYGVSLLQADVTRELNTARSALNSAQTTLEQVTQEEAVIDEYLEPYQRMDGALVSGNDRLNMQENFATIRARYGLFPIQLNLRQEGRYTLPYRPEIAQPGGPVTLLITPIEASLPLLHENDLANLVNALVEAPTLIVPTHCTLTGNSSNAQRELSLGQHLNARCSFLWYKFALPATSGGSP